MAEILKCNALSKSYGHIKALNNVNLTLESGRIVGLLGPNGSGKTTIIKLINGLLTPDAGQVTICGLAPSPESKAIVAYLPDSIYLNTWMSVQQIVDYFAEFYADFRKELAMEMLQRLGVSPKQKLKTLSKGNKEKVCLILTMSRNAKLYVLDEPIAGVDPAARDYVISTHLIADIEPILDEVVFLQNGKVVLQKEVEAIREEEGKSIDELFREVFKW